MFNKTLPWHSRRGWEAVRCAYGSAKRWLRRRGCLRSDSRATSPEPIGERSTSPRAKGCESDRRRAANYRSYFFSELSQDQYQEENYQGFSRPFQINVRNTSSKFDSSIWKHLSSLIRWNIFKNRFNLQNLWHPPWWRRTASYPAEHRVRWGSRGCSCLNIKNS